METCTAALSPKAAATSSCALRCGEQLVRVAATGIPEEVGRREATLDEQDVEVPTVHVHVTQKASEPVAQVEARITLQFDQRAHRDEFGQGV